MATGRENWGGNLWGATATWARPGGEPEEIGARFAGLMEDLSNRLGPVEWWIVEDEPWGGSVEDVVDLVAGGVSTARDGAPHREDGFTVSASGQSAQSYFGINVADGDANLGRRTPMHWVRIGFSPVAGETYDADFADHLVEALVDAWTPLEARFTTGELFRIARRGGWKVAPSYRQWLHDVVGTIERLPDGVAARRYGPGTLISMPDGWGVQQVVDASLQLYEWNGLDEFPKVAT